MKNKEPEFQDEVKHRHQEGSGIVITKYFINGVAILDVRMFNDEIIYATPAANWETVRTAYERGQV